MLHISLGDSVTVCGGHYASYAGDTAILKAVRTTTGEPVEPSDLNAYEYEIEITESVKPEHIGQRLFCIYRDITPHQK